MAPSTLELLGMGGLLLFSLSVVSDSFDPMDCSTPGFPVLCCLWSLLKLMSVESVMLFLFAPFSSCPQSFSASGSFSVSWLFIWWPKYWSFSFSISPFSQHSGLISFRTDWFDLLPVQGRLLKCK